MSRRARGALLLAGLWLAGSLAGPARAYVPPAKRVAFAVAKANRAAKRNQPLRFEVALLRGEAKEPVAEGTLLSAPDGRARLELRGGEGTLRQLRVGARLDATLDGRVAARSPLLLPPLSLLQAASGADLQKALAVLGASGGLIELGHDGALDAYVLGGHGGSALWIDMETLLPARIDLAGGAIVRFGASESFAGILWPAWMTIDQEDEPTLRIEFRGVSATTTSPEMFRRDWLLR